MQVTGRSMNGRPSSNDKAGDSHSPEVDDHSCEGNSHSHETNGHSHEGNSFSQENCQERNGPKRDGLSTEDKLNVVLIQIAAIQDRIWDCLETLREKNRLSPEVEEFARKVMEESSYWVDQCTTTSESPPILLRRTEIQFERLIRVLELIEKEKR